MENNIQNAGLEEQASVKFPRFYHHVLIGITIEQQFHRYIFLKETMACFSYIYNLVKIVGLRCSGYKFDYQLHGIFRTVLLH